jgi:hypothetical protein
MNFTLTDSQHGLFSLTAVDASGAAGGFPSDTTLTSSNTGVLSTSPAPGLVGAWVVTAVAAGTASVVAASVSTGATTTFTFSITGGPVVGFTATLTNVAQN